MKKRTSKDGMRVLHVGCFPFPTSQGTQAAVRQMLEASATRADVHFLSYARGRRVPPSGSYMHHRIADPPFGRSLRSGPSAGKMALDLVLTRTLGRLARKLSPDLVVAHHIEALLACRATGLHPVTYVAHTSLRDELPCYFSHGVRGWERLGARLDRYACRYADRAFAVSPALARDLTARTQIDVRYLPIPWPTNRQFKVGPDDARQVLYAGNLDAYQGWEDVVRAIAIGIRHMPNLRLLVATESDPTPLRSLCAQLDIVEAVQVRRLRDEEARRRAHAAATIAAIPRRSPGGLPIKLLDALGRGLPCVVSERASAGLPLGDAAVVVANDDPSAFAKAICNLVDDYGAKRMLNVAGPAYVRKHHQQRNFLEALDLIETPVAPVGVPLRTVARP